MSYTTESEESLRLNVLTDDEIDLYLNSGDRRAIDRLILLGINRISTILIRHVDEENIATANIEAIGGMSGVKQRAAFVDAMIVMSQKRGRMMQKVSESGMAYAVVMFLGFLAYSVWDSIVNAVKAKLGG